ncbi:hypothetical protein JOD44_002354 [Salimicrobium jeotgali]|nr:hypothetical protein [Salimicrobium jeotgali]
MLDLNPNNNIVVLEFYYSISQEKLKKLKEDLERNKKTNWEDLMRYMKKRTNFPLFGLNKKWSGKLYCLMR